VRRRDGIRSEYVRWLTQKPMVWIAGFAANVAWALPLAPSARGTAILLLLMAPWISHRLSHRHGRARSRLAVILGATLTATAIFFAVSVFLSVAGRQLEAPPPEE
jgi:hypothetical protein